MIIEERLRPARDYKQMAEQFGVSPGRIGQLLHRALKNFRRILEREARAKGVSPEQWLRGEF